MLLLFAGNQHLPLMKDAESVVEQRRGPFSMTRYSFIVMLNTAQSLLFAVIQHLFVKEDAELPTSSVRERDSTLRGVLRDVVATPRRVCYECGMQSSSYIRDFLQPLSLISFGIRWQSGASCLLMKICFCFDVRNGEKMDRRMYEADDESG